MLAGVLLIAACSDAGSGDGDATATSRGGANPAGTVATPTATPSGVPGLAELEATDYPDDLTDGYFLGSADAPLTLTMFEDFQCPHCLAFTLGNEHVVIEEYVLTGKVRLEFQNLPILGQDSVNAAFAAHCMAAVDLFWPFQRELFAAQARAGQLTNEQLNIGRFDVEPLTTMAVNAGADEDDFTACLVDTATRDALIAQGQRATTKGLSGTPAFLLNGIPIVTPRDPDGWRDLLGN